MHDDGLDEGALRTRFDLVELDGEGILLDRESGGVYCLNRTAHLIWSRLLGGEGILSVIDGLAQRFQISHAQATSDTRIALELPPVTPRTTVEDRFRWTVTSSGYGFFIDERQLFQVDRRGEALRLCSGFAASVDSVDLSEARMHLRSVVPKLLALRGIRVLHASAVEIEGSLLVFSGHSGAGKTTSARAFSEIGAQLVSEDLLVLWSGQGRPEAVLSGESVIRRWVADQSVGLGACPEAAIDCGGLDRCLEGGRRPIDRILLIDAERRSGDRMVIEDLRGPDALVALLDSVYFASTDSATWRDTFASLGQLVTAATTARAIMPLGLPALRAAANAFSL